MKLFLSNDDNAQSRDKQKARDSYTEKQDKCEENHIKRRNKKKKINFTTSPKIDIFKFIKWRLNENLYVNRFILFGIKNKTKNRICFKFHFIILVFCLKFDRKSDRNSIEMEEEVENERERDKSY